MKNRLIISAVGLIAAVSITPAWGFDIHRTKTEARIVPAAATAPAIQLNFKAQLLNGFVDPAIADVAVDWHPEGGIAPCLRVVIPAGCFVRNRGLHVDDFSMCGVQLTFDPDGSGQIPMSISEFEARIISRRDGTARFDVETTFMDTDQAHAILGALGGAAVEIAIGAEMGTSLPLGIESVSGVSPDPF